MFKHHLIWITALFAITLTAYNWYQKQSDKLVHYTQDLPNILYLVQEAYVDELAMEELMPGAFQGVLNAVDENASYLPPGEPPVSYREKVFQRCGLTVSKMNGYAYVLAAVEGSPAHRAGVRPDTFIQQIGTLSTRLLSRHQIEKLLATTSPLELTLVSVDSVDEEHIRFEPGSYKAPELTHAFHEGEVQVFQLPRFHKGLERELKRKLNASGEGKIVLDLRGNTMGDEKDLAMLASLFLPAGKYAAWVDAEGKTQTVSNPRSGKFAGLDLYLWIDHGTSGAAEAFSAVAQDGKIATVIGQDSMGQPLRYETIPLETGGHLRMSTTDFVLNSGKTLTRQGVTPDVLLESEEGRDIVLADALQAVRNQPSHKVEANANQPARKG